MKINFTIKPML